ncbi:hypothetical protein [Niveibacterium terrae]|uniref:hypothetical protein n=1 Tax=Niveibacterium terrae TaxID=3373598 RepID=UPI003A8F4F11
MDLSTVLSSTVLAGIVAALVSLRCSERKIHVENVTQERAKWRGAMRALAEELIKAAREANAKKVERQCALLALNVNPFDSEDKGLVETARKLSGAADIDSHVFEFTDRMALLLKHDWERAKREAHPWFFRGSEPRRVPYCEFKAAVGVPVAVGKPKSSRCLVAYFGMLALSAGIMFFLAVGLTEPFQELVKIFNDPKVEKPVGAWVQFVFLSVLCGSIWSAAYLWFKGSEKKFLDIWFSK